MYSVVLFLCKKMAEAHIQTVKKDIAHNILLSNYSFLVHCDELFGWKDGWEFIGSNTKKAIVYREIFVEKEDIKKLFPKIDNNSVKKYKVPEVILHRKDILSSISSIEIIKKGRFILLVIKKV